MKRVEPEKNDLLLSKNGTIGIPKVVDWEKEFSIFVSLCLIKLGDDLDPFFLEYVFNSQHIDEQINYGGKENTITNLHLEKIKEFFISLPPKSEQQAIVEFLDKEIDRIDQSIKKIKEAIEKLKEYRTALITSAVTGKIDVREEV
jgi:type I restriction enzyme S subunit